MNPRYLLFSLLTLFLFPVYVNAQISKPGTPPSFEMPMLKQSVPVEQMVAVDTQRLLQEDQIFDSIKDIPWRFGENIPVDLNPVNSGAWDVMPNDDRIWRLGISSPGAYTINLTFDQYRLPPGAELYVYNADRSMVLGAFTDYNNQQDGYFATTLVQGDRIFIEYYEPANVAFPGELNLELVTHAYRDPMAFAKAFGHAGSCNLNVACPEAEGWDNQINSTVMLVSGSNGFCSGAMINNTSNDGTPYLLSANHCYANPGTIIVWFNWQSTTCSNPPTSPPHDTMTGAIQRARNTASDFWLMEMNQPVPEEYNAYFAGWNRAVDAAIATTITGIHHPRGDIKKFSYATAGVQASNYLGNPGSGTSHWRIVWSGGTTTEPASSGSPIFDEQGRILGQLHGGYAACGNTLADWYGRFGVSWTGGGSNATRLSNWLDPLGLNVDAWDGYDPFGEVVENPENFDAQPLEINAVGLSWQQNELQQSVMIAVNTDNQFGNPAGPYSLGQAIAGGGTVLYIGNDESYVHQQLEYSTTYYYKAWSFSSSLRYSEGVTASAQTPDPVVFDFPAPSNLVGVLTPEKVVNLSWEAPVVEGDQPVLSGYAISRNNSQIAIITDPDILSFADSGLAVGTFMYYVTALYQNPEGESVPSNIVEVTIVPEVEQYTLVLNVTGGGTTNPSPGTHEYNDGTQVLLQAQADAHWSFSHWLENGTQVSQQPNFNVVMDQDRQITAVFILDQHTITLGSFPENTGTQSGAGTYSFGQNVVVSTTTPAGWIFQYWKEDGTVVSTNHQYSFNVAGDRLLNAHFTPVMYTVSLTANPSNGGTVSGEGNFAHGSEVTVVATPNQGWDFISWTQNSQVVSTQAEYTFEATGPMDLTANFGIQTFHINAQVQPQGSGTVTGTGTYNYGENANLTAIVYSGWQFMGWEKDGEVISTDNPWNFQVVEDLQLIARMETTERTLVVEIDGQGTTDPAPGTYTINIGEKVLLNATPFDEWIFFKWEINGEEMDTPSMEIEVSGDVTAVAFFLDATSDGLSEFDSGVKVYPVPASGTLYLDIKALNGQLEIALYSLSGQLIRSMEEWVSEKQPHSVSFNLAGINAGVYILKVTDGKQSIHQKVIVQ